MYQHPIFKRHPESRQAHTSEGEVPLPYHVYEGLGLLIGGTADLAASRDLCGPALYPLPDEAGRALAALWVYRFDVANLGPHVELQFSLFVSTRPSASRPGGELALLRHLTHSEAPLMLCAAIWNDAPIVVACNREVFGLPARACRAEIGEIAGRLRFCFEDAATRQQIAEGDLDAPMSTEAALNGPLLKALGPRGMLTAMRNELTMRVINPRGSVFPDHRAALAIGAPKTMALMRWAAADSLALGEGFPPGLDFRPSFAEYLRGFRFVYNVPEPL